eukprot:6167338-Pyramimonas_sp.AAC.1
MELATQTTEWEVWCLRRDVFLPDPSWGGGQASGGGGNGANPKGPKRGQGGSPDDLLQKYLAAAGLANDPTSLGL